jgi:hypothetical protein
LFDDPIEGGYGRSLDPAVSLAACSAIKDWLGTPIARGLDPIVVFLTIHDP